MAAKRRGLGRGLDALLGSVEPASVEPAGERSEELAILPIDLLRRGKYQPRSDIREESLQELADSIRAQGVVQPIVVRALEDADDPVRYEIVAGERRWRAAQLAGLEEIPALIRNVPDEAAVAMSLIENIQRENLNPLEEARALERLVGEFDMTHQQAAEAVGRSRAAVTNLLRLLDLSDDVKAMVERRELEMGHARALLSLAGRQQGEVAALVTKKALSVRETERLVKRLVEKGPEAAQKPTPPIDPNIRKLEIDLSDKLGAKVKLQHSERGSGRLVVSYHSLDELEGILAHIT